MIALRQFGAGRALARVYRPGVGSQWGRILAARSLPVRALGTSDPQRGDDDAVSDASSDPRRRRSVLDRVSAFFDKERCVAPEGYNRWLMVPASFLVQLSIGSVYAWSIFNEPLTRELGVVASAASDWGLDSVVPIFSSCALSLGVTTFTLGGWAERAGPRKVAATAAACWGGGLITAALGVYTHTLPLVYLGYGVFGGIGWGLGYVSPVSTLMKWFPDRRGLATGLGLTAFGGGAMVATPLNEHLLSTFRRLPEYLGSVDSVNLFTEGGKRFAEVGGAVKEVVVATQADVAGIAGAAEGVYAAGTGTAGVAATFLTLGALHFAAMMTGALNMRVPREGWVPNGYTPPKEEELAAKMMTTRSIDASVGLRTPQFYLLWAAVWGNAVAGVSVISCAKTLMNDCFGRAMPYIVDGAFAATYVAALSAANMFGRLGWAANSDRLGRKNTYFLFGAGIPIALSIPLLTQSVVDGSASVAPLVLFAGGTAAVVSFYGGLFSVLPAYIADVFGPKHTAAHHGRLLTAWSGSALTGPMLLTHLRSSSYTDAAHDLADKVDPVEFERAFGAPREELDSLLEAKSVTIGRLLELVPAGTPDPTPSLYNTTMYAMAGLMSVALLANAAMRPLSESAYRMQEEKDARAQADLSHSLLNAAKEPPAGDSRDGDGGVERSGKRE